MPAKKWARPFRKSVEIKPEDIHLLEQESQLGNRPMANLLSHIVSLWCDNRRQENKRESMSRKSHLGGPEHDSTPIYESVERKNIKEESAEINARKI